MPTHFQSLNVIQDTPILNTLPTKLTVAPIYFHVMVFATFASLIAPFGGFFASGLKRTFNVKDFGDSIPGHGGMTDRMDCQFIMGFFSFMYYQSFLAVTKASVGGVLELAIQGLSIDEQVEVVKSLSKHLVNQGVISVKVGHSKVSSSFPLLSNEVSGAREHKQAIAAKIIVTDLNDRALTKHDRKITYQWLKRPMYRDFPVEQCANYSN